MATSAGKSRRLAGQRSVSETGSAEREQIGEVQRARIVAATIETVAEKGYPGLTVAEVIARARISRRTFYELFRDREDCFMAALEEALALVRRPVMEAYEGASGWREQISAALAALLAFCDEQPTLGRLLLVDAASAGPAALRRRVQVTDALSGAVDCGWRERKQDRAPERKARAARAGGRVRGIASERAVRAERGVGNGRAAGRVRDPEPLVAEGVVGAVLGLLHARLLVEDLTEHRRPLSALAGQLMSMIVLPYLGSVAADEELARPAPQEAVAVTGPRHPQANPLHGLTMRVTYRTLRVLSTVAALPGSSNRAVADGAGIVDQGQTSKLLARLQALGLIENVGGGSASGEPNAWRLTARGGEVLDMLHGRAATR